MKISIGDSTPRLNGADLHLVQPGDTLVCQFAGYLKGSRNLPGGEQQLTLGVPFDQIPNTMQLLRQVGGVTFEFTVRRVPMDELPEPGW